MVAVQDVAAYILRSEGPMTAMKLQKLAYYCKAWHLVWDSYPLFSQRIEAWANGPVCPDLYNEHRGQFMVREVLAGDPSKLTGNEAESVDAVIGHYGQMTAYQLSELTHSEDPWRDARAGLAVGSRSSVEITDASLVEYYEGLFETP